MRDVIVIGAGGGGPVVAKELAARGLDVLLLEAGQRFARNEREWSHLENEATNPATGIFRFGPGDRSKAPWARDLPQNCFLWQTAGVGGSTLHYFGNSPRAMPGVFADYAGADADAYDRDHRFPFGYRELIPYYEWVEHTLPVQTAAMGTKEVRFLGAAEKVGLPVQTSKDISRAVLDRKRTPSCSRRERPAAPMHAGSSSTHRHRAAPSAATASRVASSLCARRRT